MCEISSATVFSPCHLIPNQMMMLDVGCCHRNSRGITANGNRLEAGSGCRGGEGASLSPRRGDKRMFLSWDGGGHFEDWD